MSSQFQSNDLNCQFVQSVKLTECEKTFLSDLATHVNEDPYSNYDSFYQKITHARSEMPSEISKEIQSFQQRLYAGCLIIQDVPIDIDLPATPKEPFGLKLALKLKTEVKLVALASLLAEPFSYKEWDSGYMIHNKYPIKSHSRVQFGSNSVEFLLHTETPFRETSPDYLALLCLREDPTGIAKTRLCDIGQVIKDLAIEEQEILQKPYFAFKTDNPAVVIDGCSLTLPQPIIQNHDGQSVFQYVHDLVAITRESRLTLEKLKFHVELSTIEIFLKTGDLLLIDNSHMAHGRSAYIPLYDGRDRWLQRLLLSKKLFDNSTYPKNRLISDKQLKNYPTDYRKVLQALEIQ